MLFPLNLMITLFYFCPYFVHFYKSSISLIPNIFFLGGNNLCLFKYIKHIYFIFSFFSEICPSWRSLSSCSTRDCFLGLLQSWHPGNLLLSSSWGFLLLFYVLYPPHSWIPYIFLSFLSCFSGIHPLRPFWERVCENKFWGH